MYLYIRESVDSLCRDDMDAQYMKQKLTTNTLKANSIYSSFVVRYISCNHTCMLPQAIAEISTRLLVCTSPPLPIVSIYSPTPPHNTPCDLSARHPSSCLISARPISPLSAHAQSVQPRGGSHEREGEVRCQREGGGGEEGKGAEGG